MKIKYLLIAALAGVALVGCNKEGGADVNDGKDTNNFYATFNIVAPASSSDTKADDDGFAFGTAEEAAVQNIRFIFYRNGSKVAISATDNFTLSGYTVGHVTGNTNDPESPFAWTDGTAGGSVEKIAQAKVILRSNGARPNEVLVFMNMDATDFTPIAEKNTLAEALEETNDISATGTKHHNEFYTTINGTNYFVMSNSAFFEGGTTEKRAYDIPSNAIKDSPQEAVDNDAITLYIERLAAKVEVNLSAVKDGVTFPTTGDGALVTSTGEKITVTPLAEDSWSLNAVQRKTYWTKNIGYDVTALGLTNGEHRTYWAVDPNYNVMSSDYDHIFPNSAYQHNDIMQDWEIYYYNTNEILSHSDKKIDGDPTSEATTAALTSVSLADKGTTNFNKTADYYEKQYALENTVGTEVANYRRTATHVIVLAQATVGDTKKQVDLYRYNNNIYEEAEWKEAILTHVKATCDFYTSTDGIVFTPISVNDFEIKKAVEKELAAGENVRIVKCDRRNSDGRVSLFLTSAARGKTWYYNIAPIPTAKIDSGTGVVTFADATEAATYVKEITESFDDASGTLPNLNNKLADAVSGIIEATNAYSTGLLYYCAPIEHLVAKSGTDPKVGNYGVVRNHWYSITVSDIKGLGTGIYDCSEPIVPGDKTPDYYLAAKININAWHKVKQSLVLVD